MLVYGLILTRHRSPDAVNNNRDEHLVAESKMMDADHLDKKSRCISSNSLVRRLASAFEQFSNTRKSTQRSTSNRSLQTMLSNDVNGVESDELNSNASSTKTLYVQISQETFNDVNYTDCDAYLNMQLMPTKPEVEGTKGSATNNGHFIKSR